MNFYNKAGTPVFYTDDNEHLYDFNGRPIGYLHDKSVYSFSGRHLGWFENGWIRDSKGRCVFFNVYAKGEPLRPVKKNEPYKEVKDVRPPIGIRKVRPMKPSPISEWSSLNISSFFRY